MGATGVVAGAGERTRLATLLRDAGMEGPVVARRHRERDWWMRRLLAGADALAMTAGVALATLVSPQITVAGDMPWLLALTPLWIVLCWLYKLYDRDTRRVSHTTVDDLPALFHATLVGAVGLWMASRVLPVQHINFGDLVIFGATTMAASLVGRLVVRGASARRWPPERVLFVGGGPSALALADRMRAHPEHRLQPVAAVARRVDDLAPHPALPSVGTYGDVPLGELVASMNIDRVVVADDLNDERLMNLVHQCQGLGVKLDLIPALFGALGTSVEVDHVGGLTMLAVNPPVLSRSDRLAKRALDIAGSAVLLFIALPLLVVIGAAIKLTTRGPMFFKQERVGRSGGTFKLYKFRSMVVDAEAQREALLSFSRDPDWLHLDDDPRVTPVGRFLRMTSLDELPQLWNVLRGDMSLVGPRPLIVEEDSNVDGWARSRLDLTPGITGLWQVLGRTTIPFEEMVKLDYLYVTNWSLWQDIRLLLRTLPAVLHQRGAN